MTCAGLLGLALLDCLAPNPRCLPPEYRPLLPILRGIKEQESGVWPWALRDETEGRSVPAASRAEAEREARERHARGHVLGLGWFQITHTRNWVRHWGSVDNALAVWADPCANLRAGAAHFAEDLGAALQRYNSGRFDGAPSYAASVLRRIGVQAAPELPPTPAPAPASAPPCVPSWDVWARCASVPSSTAPKDDPRPAVPVLLQGRILLGANHP